MPWVDNKPGHSVILAPDPQPAAIGPEVTADQAVLLIVCAVAAVCFTAFAGAVVLRLLRHRAAAQALAEIGIVTAGAVGLRVLRAISAYLTRLKARILQKANAPNP